MVKKILITCSRIVDFAGSEITTLELAEHFRRLGWDVFVATFEVGPYALDFFSTHSISPVSLGDSTCFSKRVNFDLAWFHHHPCVTRVLAEENFSCDKSIFSSLSHFEPVEAPPPLDSSIDLYLVNSKENFQAFSKNYPNLKNKVKIFNNFSSSEFFENSSQAIQEWESPLKRLAIISNHIPAEVLNAAKILEAEGIKVSVFGIGKSQRRITKDILLEFDAVVSIGKTAQYCLTLGIPFYCYDHFGGDGWITEANFEKNREYNYSGRGSRGPIKAKELKEEILNGYKSTLAETPTLRELAVKFFSLERNIEEILKYVANFGELAPIDLDSTARQIKLRSAQLFFRQLTHKAALETHKADLETRLGDAMARLRAKEASFQLRLQEIERLAQNIAVLSDKLEQQRQRLSQYSDQKKNLNAQLNALRATKLFRFTAPFRNIYFRVRNILAGKGKTEDPLPRAPNAAPEVPSTSTRNSSVVDVSFVIPVYDRTDVLRQCILSALNQSHESIEIIIVTDGSPPETLSVIAEFSHHPKVRVFNFPHSSGNAVRARNKGILEARGNFVAFLDSDDLATKDRIEISIRVAHEFNSDVVYGAWEAILDGTREIAGITDGQVISSPDTHLEELLTVCVPCQSTVMVNKELLYKTGFVKPEMEYREDHELWCRLMYFGGSFKATSSTLTKLRLHEGNNELNFKGDEARWLKCLHDQYTITGPLPKKIVFVVPGIGISGGIAVVLKHANMLIKAGHDVSISNIGIDGSSDWFPENNCPVYHHEDQRPYLFDGIDLVFATGWNTAASLENFSAKRKLYFVQSDERRFFEDQHSKAIIHSTYLLECEYVTEAYWIQDFLKSEFGHEAFYVPNGLDPKIFYPAQPLVEKNPTRLRVLIEGPLIIPFKGMADSYAAISHLDCEIWVVSSAGVPPPEWRVDRFFERVPFTEMKSIYSSCDVFLKMSRVEGFFGPPMEAMACGCAVVVGKVTGYDEYIVHEENALVVEQGDVYGAEKAVTSLIQDSELRMLLIQNGYMTASKWTWESSHEAMLNVIDSMP